MLNVFSETKQEDSQEAMSTNVDVLVSLSLLELNL
jgi:hypothetical protein